MEIPERVTIRQLRDSFYLTDIRTSQFNNNLSLQNADALNLVSKSYQLNNSQQSSHIKYPFAMQRQPMDLPDGVSTDFANVFRKKRQMTPGGAGTEMMLVSSNNSVQNTS